MVKLRTFARQLSYANVMATLAFFVAVGGTSYAAVQLTGANIKDGAIKSADLANNSVRSTDLADGKNGVQGRDVRDGSLGIADLSTAARAALKGDAGAAGVNGANGANGTNGADGAPAVIKRTLSNGSENNSLAPTGTYAKVIDVLPFTKQQAGSVVTASWDGNAYTFGTLNKECDWQLRVDGVRGDGGDVIVWQGEAGPANHFDQVATQAVFSNLAAGAHTLQLWVRGDAQNCSINAGSNPQTQLWQALETAK